MNNTLLRPGNAMVQGAAAAAAGASPCDAIGDDFHAAAAAVARNHGDAPAGSLNSASLFGDMLSLGDAAAADSAAGGMNVFFPHPFCHERGSSSLVESYLRPSASVHTSPQSTAKAPPPTSPLMNSSLPHMISSTPAASHIVPTRQSDLLTAAGHYQLAIAAAQQTPPPHQHQHRLGPSSNSTATANFTAMFCGLGDTLPLDLSLPFANADLQSPQQQHYYSLNTPLRTENSALCVPRSGFKGVSWNSRMKAWLAFYVTETGERKSKTFSTRKLGMEAARQQAIVFCREKQLHRKETRKKPRLADSGDVAVPQQEDRQSSSPHDAASVTEAADCMQSLQSSQASATGGDHLLRGDQCGHECEKSTDEDMVEERQDKQAAVSAYRAFLIDESRTTSPGDAPPPSLRMGRPAMGGSASLQQERDLVEASAISPALDCQYAMDGRAASSPESATDDDEVSDEGEGGEEDEEEDWPEENGEVVHAAASYDPDFVGANFHCEAGEVAVDSRGDGLSDPGNDYSCRGGLCHTEALVGRAASIETDAASGRALQQSAEQPPPSAAAPKEPPTAHVNPSPSAAALDDAFYFIPQADFSMHPNPSVHPTSSIQPALFASSPQFNPTAANGSAEPPAVEQEAAATNLPTAMATEAYIPVVTLARRLSDGGDPLHTTTETLEITDLPACQHCACRPYPVLVITLEADKRISQLSASSENSLSNNEQPFQCLTPTADEYRRQQQQQPPVPANQQ